MLLSNRLFLMRINEAAAELGVRQSAYYEGAAAGIYPRPFKIGLKASRVPSNEVAAVVAARIGSKSDDELRALVTKMAAARTENAPADAAYGC